jgi:hypothetical protein
MVGDTIDLQFAIFGWQFAVTSYLSEIILAVQKIEMADHTLFDLSKN